MDKLDYKNAIIEYLTQNYSTFKKEEDTYTLIEKTIAIIDNTVKEIDTTYRFNEADIDNTIERYLKLNQAFDRLTDKGITFQNANTRTNILFFESDYVKDIYKEYYMNYPEELRDNYRVNKQVIFDYYIHKTKAYEGYERVYSDFITNKHEVFKLLRLKAIDSVPSVIEAQLKLCIISDLKMNSYL